MTTTVPLSSDRFAGAGLALAVVALLGNGHALHLGFHPIGALVVALAAIGLAAGSLMRPRDRFLPFLALGLAGAALASALLTVAAAAPCGHGCL